MRKYICVGFIILLCFVGCRSKKNIHADISRDDCRAVKICDSSPPGWIKHGIIPRGNYYYVTGQSDGLYVSVVDAFEDAEDNARAVLAKFYFTKVEIKKCVINGHKEKYEKFFSENVVRFLCTEEKYKEVYRKCGQTAYKTWVHCRVPYQAIDRKLEEAGFL